MRRRRYYGKPPPSKKQVQAHYDFYAQVDKAVVAQSHPCDRDISTSMYKTQEGKKMVIELTQEQKRYIVRLISADLHTMVRNMDHAVCYGSEIVLPDAQTAADILTKIQNV